MSKASCFASGIPAFDPERVRFHNLRYCPVDWRDVLAGLVWDRTETSFAEVRRSILDGDVHLALRLFTTAPNTFWIARILGREHVLDVWKWVKRWMDQDSARYDQCVLFFELHTDWLDFVRPLEG